MEAITFIDGGETVTLTEEDLKALEKDNQERYERLYPELFLDTEVVKLETK